MRLLNVALRLPRLRRLVEERNALQAERDRLASVLAAQNGELHPGSPFLHYNAIFDPQEVVRRHALPSVRGTAGYLTNFLGVRIDPKFFRRSWRDVQERWRAFPSRPIGTLTSPNGVRRSVP
jgi:hypothetical protein